MNRYLLCLLLVLASVSSGTSWGSENPAPGATTGPPVGGGAGQRPALTPRPGADRNPARLAGEAGRPPREPATTGAGSGDHYALGVRYERRGSIAQAEREYRAALAQAPNNCDARRRLADIYTLKGDFAAAVGEYRALLLSRGDNPLLHFKLARVLERDHKYLYAIEQYLDAIKLAPENIEARKELAALYRKRGRREDAADQYRVLLNLNRKDVPVRNALMALYTKQRKYQELFELLQEGEALFPDDPESHYRMGLMHNFRKEYQPAVAEYLQALDLKKDHARAMKGLGKVYLSLGDLERSQQYLQAAKAADPNLLEADELLARLQEVKALVSAVKVRGGPGLTKPAAKGRRKVLRAKRANETGGKCHTEKKTRTEKKAPTARDHGRGKTKSVRKHSR